jgi:DNA-3-methyladenine glycosylase
MLNHSDYIKLKRTFYTRDTVTVAKELLGKYIFKKSGKGFLCGRIVETEAYLGDEDPACHAFRKVTKRNEPMFEDGGIAYVYFIYGNYYCFNAVTEKQGTGSAVLIRGVEPVSGIQAMRKNRGVIRRECDLTNGPSKFCLAFNIDKKDNWEDLTKERIFISKSKKKESITVSVAKRIGIKEGADLPYRYFIKDNPYVTRHKLNKEIITEIKL